jgi:hypothetical protein
LFLRFEPRFYSASTKAELYHRKMPKVLSSWSMGNDGKLIENDLKLSYSEEDGSYTIESKHDSIGIILGSDGTAKKYTVITSIPDTKR